MLSMASEERKSFTGPVATELQEWCESKGRIEAPYACITSANDFIPRPRREKREATGGGCERGDAVAASEGKVTQEREMETEIVRKKEKERGGQNESKGCNAA